MLKCFKTHAFRLYAKNKPDKRTLDEIQNKMNQGYDALILGTAPLVAQGFIDPRDFRCDCPLSSAFAISKKTIKKTGACNRILGTAAAADYVARLKKVNGVIGHAEDIVIPLYKEQEDSITDRLLDSILLDLKYGDRKARKVSICKIKRAFMKDPQLGDHSRKQLLAKLPLFVLKALWMLMCRNPTLNPDPLDFCYLAGIRGSYAIPQTIEAQDFPQVSVIMRTCNRPETLRRTLESLRFQKYPNFEVILIEDGNALSKYMVESEFSDLKIRYYSTGKNIGRAAAANMGFSLATGKYLNMLDDDDYLFPEHLSVGIRTAEATSSDMVFLQSLAFEIEETSKIPYEYTIEKMHFMNFPRINPFTMTDSCKTPNNGVLFRRTLYERMGGMREELGANEDWSLWLRFMTIGTWTVVPYATCGFVNPASKDKKTERENAYREFDGEQLKDSILRYTTLPDQMQSYFNGVIADWHRLMELGRLDSELVKEAEKHSVCLNDTFLDFYKEFTNSLEINCPRVYTAMDFYHFYCGWIAHMLSLDAGKRVEEINHLYNSNQ